MAYLSPSYILPLLFLILTVTVTVTATNNTTTTTTTAFPSTTRNSAQQNTIIDAIIDATDFSNWANLLSGSDSSSIPLSATLFLPAAANDGAYPVSDVIPPATTIVPRPRRLTFSELQLFPVGARLPTLVPGAALKITNNSADNFTLNAVNGVLHVIKPDIYQNAIVVVHGVDGFLDQASSPQAEFRLPAGGRTRRRQPRKSLPDVQAPPVMVTVSAASVKASYSWGQVAIVVTLGLLVLHILGFPSMEIVCGVVRVPARRSDAYSRYSAGCTWSFHK